jgi:hypothetical protein
VPLTTPKPPLLLGASLIFVSAGFGNCGVGQVEGLSAELAEYTLRYFEVLERGQIERLISRPVVSIRLHRVRPEVVPCSVRRGRCKSTHIDVLETLANIYLFANVRDPDEIETIGRSRRSTWRIYADVKRSACSEAYKRIDLPSTHKIVREQMR